MVRIPVKNQSKYFTSKQSSTFQPVENDESNEKVVQFVQDSNKFIVRVELSSWYDGTLVSRPNGRKIGNLNYHEKRVYPLKGRKHDYLINVNKAKSVRNGILHLDILEEDASYIIGPRGAHIKAVTKELNRLGCRLNIIKVHPHFEREHII